VVETNGVMEELTEQMVSLDRVGSEAAVGRLSEEEAAAAFTRAMEALMEKLERGSTQQPRRRWKEHSISTHYKRVLKKRKLSEAEGQAGAAAAVGEAAEGQQADTE
jgi:hypothetical protein